MGQASTTTSGSFDSVRAGGRKAEAEAGRWRWLHGSSLDRKERGVECRRTSGAPIFGLISWDHEGGHDDECDQIGCPSYELMPACAKCLQDPNVNHLKQPNEREYGKCL